MSEDLISVLVLGEELEVDPSKPQIIIKHGNHKGRLHNGKVREGSRRGAGCGWPGGQWCREEDLWW